MNTERTTSRQPDRHPVASPPADTAGPSGQQPLPFDDEADQPIGYALTAAAHRAVAPAGVPPLRPVPDRPGAPPTAAAVASGVDDAALADPALDDPGDTRPSRARALRRAGLAPAVIASQLGVDELLVQAWVDRVAVRPRPRTSHVRALETSAAPGAHARGAASAAAADTAADTAAGGAPDHDEAAAGRALARAAATAAARRRLLDDAPFAAGVGLLGAAVEVSEHALTLETRDPQLAGRVLAWLHAELGLEPARVRVVLRLGSEVAGDLARRRWADALAAPADRVTATRSRGLAAPDAVEALVRITDADVATAVAAWRDALLEDPVPSVDVAF